MALKHLNRGRRPQGTNVSTKGEWIANCLPERVERIAKASVFFLSVGPPQPNQLQTTEDLEAQGLVGLYKGPRKSAGQTATDQRDYLDQSDFTPTPSALSGFLGPLGGGGGARA